MLVKYIGPIEAVEIAATGDIVARGDTIEVDTDLGIGLCEQTVNWEPADADSVAVLDEFYRWVAAHVKRFDPAAGMDVWIPLEKPEPAAEAAPEPSPRRTRATTPDPAPADTAQEG